MATLTPRLSEVARHVVVPEGIVSTAWPRVVAKCAELDVEFDSWQHGIGSAALGKRANGKYAATVGGIVLSIPRQVGKTFLVGMICIALCLLFPGLTILWTAHRTRTATKTFHTLKGMTERARVKPHMLDPRLSNGEQELRFRNGSVIMFGAREQGFGRGFDEIDVEVFDEAQILTEKALEDMVPATNQSRQAAGALLFFMGTPPRPTDPGEEFTNRRKRALDGSTTESMYVEFSADRDSRLDDKSQWRKANPSYPDRTTDEAMQRMRENLTDEDSFRREALGIWPEEHTSLVFPEGAWEGCADLDMDLPDGFVFAADAPPDRSEAFIAAASKDGDNVNVNIQEARRGLGWVAEWLIDKCRRYSAPVAIDPRSALGSIIPRLEAEGVTVIRMSAGDVATACGQFYDAVTETRLRHLDDPILNLAVAGAAQRPLGDAWAWNRRTATSNVSPLIAATNAVWLASTTSAHEPDIYFI